MKTSISLKTRRSSQTTVQHLDLEKTALVLIDVWTQHPNKVFRERMASNIKQKTVPLVELARRHNIKIVHCPHEFPKGIADGCKPLPGERVIHTGTELHKYLGECGVKTLLYAGYAVNRCILNRPEGIPNIKPLGYNIILLRDCTIAKETQESLEGELKYHEAISKIETNWGCTSTLDDLKAALEEAQEV